MITAQKIQDTLNQLCQLKVVKDGLAVLADKLPKNLAYHSLTHTHEVLYDVVLFGLEDSLSPRSLELLAVAAVMHDTGFIQAIHNNEAIGAKYARGAMLRTGDYADSEIKLVEQMILDTALVEKDGLIRQIPSTKLSKYLLDADLGNFGREDFFHKSTLLREELGQDEVPFNARTLALISAHEWHTPAAKKLRQATKAANAAALRARVLATP